MKKSFLIASLATLVLTACEMPDIAGLNSMPEKTGEMSKKMDQTNDSVRMQKMAIALDQLEKPENQARISPVPTGLLAWAKVFAEAAKPSELAEFFYVSIKGLEEVNPATGLDKDGMPIDYTDADKARVRLQKMASLSGLMAIAAFAQQEKIDEIIATEIKGNGRFQEASLAMLALRASFLRDTLLAQSLNVRTDSAKVLTNSGMMNEALKYLYQLDQISRLPFHDDIYVKIEEKGYGLISFEERQDLAGQKATAEIWKLALKKSLSGISSYKKSNWTDNQATNEQMYNVEISKQTAAANKMQSYVDSWAQLLK